MRANLSPATVWAGVHPLASYGRRYQAALIDSIIQSVGLVVAIMGLLADDMALMIALLLLGIIILPGIYETWMVARSGQTLGKRAAGIRVVGIEDGGAIGWGRAAIRYAFKVAAIVPPVFLLDALSYVMSLNNQTLHDRAAGTVVVRVA